MVYPSIKSYHSLIYSHGLHFNRQLNSLRQQNFSLSPKNIQAYAISWRVGNCMSITSAVSFDFDYK
jgi:hypothetical protein